MTRTSVLFALAALAACTSDSPTETGDTAMVESTRVTWELGGLAPLGDGFVYEGWIIVDGEPVSTGRFDVDADGVASQTSFDVTTEQEAAAAFVLTIEPEPDDDPGPAATKLLGGDFADGSAVLSIAHPAALGDDLTGATAPYILNTPTTATDDTDWFLGIWWLDPGAGPGASANLPTLPDGWTYEGWVVGADGPVSTGTFTDKAGEDSDAGGPTAGSDGAPPFPGQDYIDPAVDLRGLTAVISVEPVPDDGAGPFLLKPLVDTIDDVGIGVLQDMENQAASNNPTGDAWFE